MHSVSTDALFFRALAVPRAARDAWITRTCADDPARGRELRTLVQAHETAGPLLDAVPPGLPHPMRGNRIARYTLGRRLGEGGCGVVFAARPRAGEAVPSLVALKLIRPGLASPEAIARLATEGRALARLDHPGVPRFVDAGRTEAGDAFLAMELVRGRPLTAHCDIRRLPVAERLELFARFCDVLGHLHDRGVRHGDLEPANVLVRRIGASRPEGSPVIIDFGLASLATGEGNAPDPTTGAVTAGTLPYLSPEQVSGAAATVDHRSDLYAAGVVLHQLLTGRAPFRGGALDELRRWFANPDMVPPSRVVAALPPEERLRLARRRSTSVNGLAGVLRGDVDTVVQRAVAREPVQRFQTATEFAAAIRRLLTKAPRPWPACAALAFPVPPGSRSATRATFPGRSARLRRETPAAAA